MKASLLFVMAASMIIGTALNAQTNPYPNDPARPRKPLPLPPPSATRRTITPSVQERFNLNGVWQGIAPGGVTTTLRFEENGENFRVFILLPNSSELLEFRDGRYSGSTISGKRLFSQGSPGHPAQWVNANVIIDDPDHVHAEGMPSTARKSPAHASDAVCDASNSSRTKGEYAAQRAKDAETHRDYVTAACWARTGALQNDPTAEGHYAWLFEKGWGITKDYPQALYWAKKAGEQGDITGEMVMQTLYTEGEGVPVDFKVVDYWHQQEVQTLARNNKQREEAARNQPAQQSPIQTAQANGQHQMTQSEAEALAAIAIILGGDSPSNAQPSIHMRPEDAYDEEECKAAGGRWVTIQRMEVAGGGSFSKCY
jgi:hypothetical protein